MKFLTIKFTYQSLRVIGFCFIAAYLYFNRDFRFSIAWASMYIVIALLVSTIMHNINLKKLFPNINTFHFNITNRQQFNPEMTERELDRIAINNMKLTLKGSNILFSISEDGLISVPILVTGISVFSAVFGGIAFGLLFLINNTYFNCLAKTITYSLAIFYILPHGILTIIAGHFAMNFFGLIAIRIFESKI